MKSVRITQIPRAREVSDGDQFLIWQGGRTRSVDLSEIRVPGPVGPGFPPATDDQVRFGSGLAGFPQSYDFSSSTTPDTAHTARMIESMFGIPLTRFGVRPDINTALQANRNAQGLQDAVSFALSQPSGGVLLAPPGKIYLGAIAAGPGSSAGIAKAVLGAQTAKLFGIVAPGSNITQFLCVKSAGSNGLVDIFAPDPSNFFFYRGFTILAAGVCSGKALRTACIYGPADIHWSSVKIQDVRVSPFARTSDYFAGGGIDIQGQWQPRLQSITVSSAFPPPTDGSRAQLAAYYSDASLLYQMPFGVEVSTCYGVSFNDIKVDGTAVQIRQDNTSRADGTPTPTGAGQPAFEGLSILDFVLQSGKTSLLRKGVGGARDAQVILDNGHCNARDVTLDISGSKSVSIGAVQFYQDGNIASPLGNPTDIRLTNVERIAISGQVEFYGLAGAASEGAAVDKASKPVDVGAGNGRIHVVLDGSTYAQDIIVGGAFNGYALYALACLGANYGRVVFTPGLLGANVAIPVFDGLGRVNTLVPSPSGGLRFPGWITNGDLAAAGSGSFGTLSVGGLSVGVGPWAAFTPIISADTGTLGSASGAGAYQVVGKTVFFRVAITVTANGSGGGALNFTLPLGLQSKGIVGLAVKEQATTFTFYDCVIPLASGIAKIYNRSLGYPVTTAGMVFHVSGSYETN